MNVSLLRSLPVQKGRDWHLEEKELMFPTLLKISTCQTGISCNFSFWS